MIGKGRLGPPHALSSRGEDEWVGNDDDTATFGLREAHSHESPTDTPFDPTVVHGRGFGIR